MKMHFLIPVAPKEKAPAPHMVSGEPAGAIPLAAALREQIGHQGQPYRFACNPRGVTNEQNAGSGEPWALLTVINNQVAIPESSCIACVNSKEWKDAYEAWKEDNDGRPHPTIRLEEAASSGGCC